MVCKGCGAESPKGAKVCGECGRLMSKSSKFTCRNVPIVVIVASGFYLCVMSSGCFYPPGGSQYAGCLQSMQSLSKGLHDYLSAKGDFNDLPQSDGNGEEICNYVIPGAKKAADCTGEIPKRNSCLDYKVDVNRPALFKYEISGHSIDKMKCGICVTEAGYCPTKYSGDEPQNSPCRKSCVAAGLNSTAVCPH